MDPGSGWAFKDVLAVIEELPFGRFWRKLLIATAAAVFMVFAVRYLIYYGALPLIAFLRTWKVPPLPPGTPDPVALLIVALAGIATGMVITHLLLSWVFRRLVLTRDEEGRPVLHLGKAIIRVRERTDSKAPARHGPQ